MLIYEYNIDNSNKLIIFLINRLKSYIYLETNRLFCQKLTSRNSIINIII